MFGCEVGTHSHVWMRICVPCPLLSCLSENGGVYKQVRKMYLFLPRLAASYSYHYGQLLTNWTSPNGKITINLVLLGGPADIRTSWDSGGLWEEVKKNWFIHGHNLGRQGRVLIRVYLMRAKFGKEYYDWIYFQRAPSDRLHPWPCFKGRSGVIFRFSSCSHTWWSQHCFVCFSRLHFWCPMHASTDWWKKDGKPLTLDLFRTSFPFSFINLSESNYLLFILFLRFGRSLGNSDFVWPPYLAYYYYRGSVSTEFT